MAKYLKMSFVYFFKSRNLISNHDFLSDFGVGAIFFGRAGRMGSGRVFFSQANWTVS